MKKKTQPRKQFVKTCKKYVKADQKNFKKLNSTLNHILHCAISGDIN